jgi:glycosyltransferase involved in cell wall biosynthesis
VALDDDPGPAGTGVSHVHITFLLMNAFSMGGTIRTTYNVAAGLAERHDVEIVSLYRRRPAGRFVVDPRVAVRTLSDQVPTDGDIAAHPFGRCGGMQELGRRLPSVVVPRSERRYRNFSLLTDVRLIAFLRGLDDGVLVTTRPGLNLAAARYAKASVVRVGQEHMFLANHPARLRRQIERHYPRLDLVSVLTERDADDYRSLLGNRVRIERVPNAVPDPGSYRTGDAKVVVAAGRLTRQKGFDLLVDAYAQVARRHPDWQLHIYGSGPERDRLLAQIRRLDLGGRVRLMGYTDRLSVQMSRAAIYVMSSRVEGFPMVLLEAMAVGLPVVSFDCPNGPADLVRQGSNGTLVPAGDVRGLADALSAVMADPGCRARMGEAARATARQYDIGRICHQWEDLFDELSHRSRASRRNPCG